MSSMTRDDVLKLAQLAKLDLTNEEIEEYAEELAKILDYVQQLQAVDVDGLTPTSQVTGLSNVMRADEVRDYGYQPKDLLKNVPSVEKHQIKVKKVL